VLIVKHIQSSLQGSYILDNGWCVIREKKRCLKILPTNCDLHEGRNKVFFITRRPKHRILHLVNANDMG
jgi:hypothetical protein